jgi:hypothetical protein
MLGLALNLFATLISFLVLAFAVWKWLSKGLADLGERLSAVETHVKHLLRAHGSARREEDCDG